MKALAIFGIVIGSLILLILLVLLIPISLSLKAGNGGDFDFSVRVLGIKVFSGNDKKKKEKKKIPEKAKKPKKKFDLKTVAGQLENIIESIKSISGGLVYLIKHFRIDKFHFKAVCASDDAAKTALDYGAACAIAYPIFGYIEQSKNVNKRNIKTELQCDFAAEKSVFSVDAKASARVFHIVCALIKSMDGVSGIAEVIKNGKH